ncbi:MAG: calcium/sodium antiporter [Acidimicrobiia bacterium]|nr:calcium/sodium antiporter [Acidimicrobiia bacterium]
MAQAPLPSLLPLSGIQLLLSILSVVLGLILLMGASDRFVESAVRLARTLGVSIVLIGALIVGLGTSLPELLVSAIASIDGNIDIAMANVTGSNVANVTLVLGVAAMAAPIMSRTLILRREGVLMFVAVLGLTAVLWDGEVYRWEGGLLLLGMAVTLVLLIRWSASDPDGIIELDEDEKHSVSGELLIGVAALAVTIFAARLLLNGALDLGERFGLGEAFLGVMLGVGTSLPELATTLAAVRRHESDLVIGNVLGSNLFNSLAVAGAAAVAGPGPLVDLARPALVVMVVVIGAAGWFAWNDRKVVRREGIVLLGIFLLFAVLSY